MRELPKHNLALHMLTVANATGEGRWGCWCCEEACWGRDWEQVSGARVAATRKKGSFVQQKVFDPSFC